MAAEASALDAAFVNISPALPKILLDRNFILPDPKRETRLVSRGRGPIRPPEGLQGVR